MQKHLSKHNPEITHYILTENGFVYYEQTKSINRQMFLNQMVFIL